MIASAIETAPRWLQIAFVIAMLLPTMIVLASWFYDAVIRKTPPSKYISTMGHLMRYAGD